MAADLNRNRDLILVHERKFAGKVAGEVVDKPILAMWMILIPIFFVFYFFQLKRYKNGLKDFSKNFMVTRERVADAVYEAVDRRKDVDIDGVVAVSDIPVAVTDRYRSWVEVLAEHFQALIQVNGASYEELVKSAYRKKSNYQLILNKLNRAEDDLNRALAEHLPGDAESITSVVKSMQKCVKEIRRCQAEEIFS